MVHIKTLRERTIETEHSDLIEVAVKHHRTRTEPLLVVSLSHIYHDEDGARMFTADVKLPTSPDALRGIAHELVEIADEIEAGRLGGLPT